MGRAREPRAEGAAAGVKAGLMDNWIGGLMGNAGPRFNTLTLQLFNHACGRTPT